MVIPSPLRHDPSAARLAAEAKKHVLVGSPAAGTLEEVGATIDACKKAGVTFAVGQTLRCTPSIQTIKKSLAGGKLGEPGILRVHRWRGKENGSPTTLVEKLFTDIDLALWLFDTNPTEIYVLGRLDNDYLQVHFGFPEGGMAILDFSTSLPAGKGYASVSLIGSRGAAYSDDHHNTHLLYGGGDPAALISNPDQGHVAVELQAFVNTIANKTRPPHGNVDCLAIHQVVDAVKRSLDSGQVLRFQGDGYEPA